MYRTLFHAGILIAAMAAVIAFSGADVLSRLGRSDLAFGLPGYAESAARARLPLAGSGQYSALALSALRATPLHEPALAWIALARGPVPDDRMTTLAGRLGWRDGRIQRQLFNFAVQHGDYGQAMFHVDAILRLGGPAEDVEQRLVVGAQIDRFRAAMLPYFYGRAPWSEPWLVRNGAHLPDEALLQLAAAVTDGKGGFPRESAGALIGALVGANRPALAARLSDRIAGHTTTFPLVLSWPEPSAVTGFSPFDWHLGEGYAVETASGAGLVAHQPSPDGLTFRLLALDAGDYVVTVAAATDALEGWRWSIGCGSRPTAVVWKLEPSNTFSVVPDCPLQWLALRADLGSRPLKPLRIEPVAEDSP